MMRKRIGILGGTFNPIHNGHLLIAEQAREQAELDEVWLMPTRIPPHKTTENLLDPLHRLRMVELATSDHSSFRALDLELKREGASYTFDTMQFLTQMYPEMQFYFIVGGDMLEILPQWHRFSELCEMVHFIGFQRPGSRFDDSGLQPYVTMIDVPSWDISSTLIRAKAKKSQSLRYLVPPAVECYIKEHTIYE